MAKVRVSVYVSRETLDGLRQLARKLGLVTARGSQVGIGNLSALLEAIAKGDVVASGLFFESTPPETFEAFMSDMNQKVDKVTHDLQELERRVEEELTKGMRR